MSQKSNNFSLNIPDSKKPRIVIIGGGFGGLHLIRKLNRSRYQVVLLDRYNYHTFQPLLYQVATAGLEPDSVAGPLRKSVRKKQDYYFRMVTVHSVHPGKKTIQTSAGELSYDYLVIATGSKINFFNNQSISENGFPLKQITHALDLRSTIFQQLEELEILSHKQTGDNYMTFVVVGGGPTGVEVCGALSELRKHVLPKDYPDLDLSRMKIYLVEGLDRVLPAMSETSSRRAKKYLEALGVQVMLNCLTESYDGKTVKLNNGKEIEANTLIWAAGVKGNLIRGFPDGSTKKSKILVNEYNQVYSDAQEKKAYRELFAIGDVAHLELPEYPSGLPGLAPVAIQQGKHLAKNLDRIAKNKSMKPFHYVNKGVMATVGRNRALADLPGNIRLTGILGWISWMALHLLYLVGFRNKVIVLANWMWNYFTYDRGIRLIIRPSTKKKDKVSHEMIREMHESGQ